MFTKNFGVKTVMETSVLLTWEVPETYKSQVPLKVKNVFTPTQAAAPEQTTQLQLKEVSTSNLGPSRHSL